MIASDLVQGEFSAVRVGGQLGWSFFAISAADLSVLSGKKTLTAENAENCRLERRVYHRADCGEFSTGCGLFVLCCAQICVPGRARAK